MAEEVLKRCSLNGAWVQPSHGAIIQYAARMGLERCFNAHPATGQSHSSSQVTPDGLRGLSQNVARSLGLSPARAFRFCTSPVLASGCILAIGISALGLDRTDASVARICEA